MAAFRRTFLDVVSNVCTLRLATGSQKLMVLLLTRFKIKVDMSSLPFVMDATKVSAKSHASSEVKKICRIQGEGICHQATHETCQQPMDVVLSFHCRCCFLVGGVVTGL